MGKGIATASVKKAIITGFKDLDIFRIEALVDPENIASQKVMAIPSVFQNLVLDNAKALAIEFS